MSGESFGPRTPSNRAHPNRTPSSDQASFWSLYRPTSSRTKRPIPTLKPPEMLNVSQGSPRIGVSPSQMKAREDVIAELMTENENLKAIVERQGKSIKKLTELVKRMNSFSEVDSSDSQQLDRHSAVVPVVRVTPTKRESSSSSTNHRISSMTDSTQRSSSNSEPTFSRGRREVSFRATTIRARRSLFNQTNDNQENQSTPRSSSSSTTPIVTPVSQGLRVPAARGRRAPAIQFQRLRSDRNGNLREQLLEELTAQNRRAGRVQENETASNRLTRSEPRGGQANVQIEALGDPNHVDANWNRAKPLRLYLERNRPEFIRRLELRQELIRLAAARRTELESSKRNAARAVAVGENGVLGVRRILFADSTNIRAFSESEVRDLTRRNLRKSGDYKTRVWREISQIDAVSNRILAKALSVRLQRRSPDRLSGRTLDAL